MVAINIGGTWLVIGAKAPGMLVCVIGINATTILLPRVLIILITITTITVVWHVLVQTSGYSRNQYEHYHKVPHQFYDCRKGLSAVFCLNSCYAGREWAPSALPREHRQDKQRKRNERTPTPTGFERTRARGRKEKAQGLANPLQGNAPCVKGRSAGQQPAELGNKHPLRMHNRNETQCVGFIERQAGKKIPCLRLSSMPADAM